MHSLANGFNEEDLTEFDERVKKFLNLSSRKNLEYICEPKIDGLSLNLTYKNGNLITDLLPVDTIIDFTTNPITVEIIYDTIPVIDYIDTLVTRKKITNFEPKNSSILNIC